MFRLTKQVFIALPSFSGSWATKSVYLSNESCMTRPTLIDLNPIELNDYPFMINLDKCNWGCNANEDLSTKMYVPSETEDINVKVFHITGRINEATTFKTYFMWL